MRICGVNVRVLFPHLEQNGIAVRGGYPPHYSTVDYLAFSHGLELRTYNKGPDTLVFAVGWWDDPSPGEVPIG